MMTPAKWTIPDIARSETMKQSRIVIAEKCISQLFYAISWKLKSQNHNAKLKTIIYA